MVKPAKWLDRLAFAFSVIIVGMAAAWVLGNTSFFQTLEQDQKLAWHLTRASGICAYLFLTASMIWGLFVSTQYVKNWSPGALSMTLHSAISWIGLLMSLAHALLLLFDTYYSYALTDLFVPFVGPYRPLAVGLGTLTFWGMLVVAVSFPFKKRLGHRAWKTIHMLSYVTFTLVTVHALAAGTDSGRLGFRIQIGVSVGLVVLLLGIRLGQSRSEGERPAARPGNTSVQRRATRTANAQHTLTGQSGQ